jgi:hypothetical protein
MRAIADKVRSYREIPSLDVIGAHGHPHPTHLPEGEGAVRAG